MSPGDVALVARTDLERAGLLVAERDRLRRRVKILEARLAALHCAYCGHRACHCGLNGYEPRPPLSGDAEIAAASD